MAMVSLIKKHISIALKKCHCLIFPRACQHACMYSALMSVGYRFARIIRLATAGQWGGHNGAISDIALSPFTMHCTRSPCWLFIPTRGHDIANLGWTIFPIWFSFFLSTTKKLTSLAGTAHRHGRLLINLRMHYFHFSNNFPRFVSLTTRIIIMLMLSRLCQKTWQKIVLVMLEKSRDFWAGIWHNGGLLRSTFIRLWGALVIIRGAILFIWVEKQLWLPSGEFGYIFLPSLIYIDWHQYKTTNLPTNLCK